MTYISRIFYLLLILSFPISVFADSQGKLNISGYVPERSSISVIDTPGTDFSNLGFQSYTNQVVGKVSLSSNDENGFKVTIYSDNNSTLKDTATSEHNNSNQIPYTVSLSNANGTLGEGVIEPDLQNISPNQDGTALNFVGENAGPSDREYDIALSLPQQALNQGNFYTDSIIIQITNL